MIDLSHLLNPDPIGCLAPTSQGAGQQPAHNGAAMSAPGTPSPSINQDDVIDPPFVEALEHNRRTVNRGLVNRDGPAGTRDALVRSNPDRGQ
jgi:hypothetical protein